jgi:hypothetical chaperone protein
MTRAIGLDFGTTNSALALAQPDRTVRLADFSGHSTFRSILFFDGAMRHGQDLSNIVAGPQAIQAYLSSREPGRLVQSMKSFLTSRLFNKTQIAGHAYTLEELIGTLLRELRREAEAQMGELGTRLVVGRPVRFSGAKDESDEQFALTRLTVALHKAGFEDITFFPEPVAAAYNYQRRIDHSELVLIADFGGGTSDFSLVQLGPSTKVGADGVGQVVGTEGVGIAGDAFDSKLVRHLVAPMLGLGSKYKSQFGKTLTVPNWLYEHLEQWHYLSFLKTRKNLDLLGRIRFHSLDPEKIAALIELVENDLGFRLYQAIEETKCNLSESASSEFSFSESGSAIVERVRRKDFEGWIDRDLRQISECIDHLLHDCNAGAADVDAIFMTGGSSFVPAIRQLFETKFPARVPLHSGQEFTSVAEGLALHALELLA